MWSVIPIEYYQSTKSIEFPRYYSCSKSFSKFQLKGIASDWRSLVNRTASIIEKKRYWQEIIIIPSWVLLKTSDKNSKE